MCGQKKDKGATVTKNEKDTIHEEVHSMQGFVLSGLQKCL